MKTSRYGYRYSLAEIAYNAHEMSLVMTELYGDGVFFELKWLNVQNVMLILWLKTIVTTKSL